MKWKRAASLPPVPMKLCCETRGEPRTRESLRSRRRRGSRNECCRTAVRVALDCNCSISHRVAEYTKNHRGARRSRTTVVRIAAYILIPRFFRDVGAADIIRSDRVVIGKT